MFASLVKAGHVSLLDFPKLQIPPPQASKQFHTLDLSSHFPQEKETAETATRQAEIITIDGVEHYAKNIKYGNQRAAEEVLMAKYMALTGLPTPVTHLGTGCQNLFHHSPENRRDFSKAADCRDLACVVSQMEATFKDLGRFLLEDGITEIEQTEPQIKKYERCLTAYQAGCEAEKTALQSAELKALIKAQPPEDKLTNEQKQLLQPLRSAKRQQLDTLQEMYHLLPDALHKEMELAFYASEFIDNYDFLNFSLFNTGFVMRDGVLRAMVVDYGNCGPSGFKGEYKEDSFEVAKQRARVQDPIAANTLIQQTDVRFSPTRDKRHRSQSTNDLPQSSQSSNAHKQDRLRSQSADNLSLPGSITNLGGSPRNRPFVGLFKDNIKAETAWRMDGVGTGSLKNAPKKLDSALEMAYRLSLIPEPVLLEVAQAHWPVGSDSRFPFHKPDHPENLDAKGIATTMQERREAYIKKFTPEQIQHWVEQNVERATLAHKEVVAACEKACATPNIPEQEPAISRNDVWLTRINKVWLPRSALKHNVHANWQRV